MSATRLLEGRQLHPLLEAELKAVATRLRSGRLHRSCARTWLWVLGWAAIAWLACRVGVVPVDMALTGVVLGCAAAIVRNVVLARRMPLNYAEAARLIEQVHPELKQALATAVEQEPDDQGRYHFLQQRVIEQAVRHARDQGWGAVGYQTGRAAVWHWGAMAAVFAALFAIAAVPRRPLGMVFSVPARGVTVTPGDAEVERGSIVLVAARVEGPLPSRVQVTFKTAKGESRTLPLVRNLADPLFAAPLPPVQEEITYTVEHDGVAAGPFKLTPFDYPALQRADAQLRFPAYTGLAEKTVEDTRRVSAVEGTALVYSFNLNKAVKSAVLRDAEGQAIELQPSNPERSQFRLSTTIARTQRFKLELKDDRGRSNAAPIDIRLEALPNRTPTLKLVHPRGDQHPSALEELHLAGEAHDDFGLLDYGVGYAVREAEPEHISLREGEFGKRLDAAFAHVMALEAKKVEPEDLVTWFIWADDHGPDGAVRRTRSDVFFAEVRPFDEEYREEAANAANASQQGQEQGGDTGNLLELQRQISISLWKERQETKGGDEAATRVSTIRESQQAALKQLAQMQAEMTEPRHKAAADAASRGMRQALDSLSAVRPQDRAEPLIKAWNGSQLAYRSLLKLQPRETRVARSREARSQGGRQGRNQRQMQQLDFKQSDDRYETESQAQPLTSPEEREQLSVLAKLRELSRRQQDINERLRELQAALAAAEDEKRREEVQRELKRLEEEQRRMLADVDETRERLDRMSPTEQSRRAQEQLEQTREQMQQSSEQLSRGEPSRALASGSRASEQLERTREDFRKESSSQFSEQLRDARQQARDISERQKDIERQFSEMGQGGKSLDDSESAEKLARSMEEQKGRVEKLVRDLREVSDGAEEAEPQLHRKLYDLVRQQGQNELGRKLEAGAEMVKRGLTDQSRELQPLVSQDIEQLKQGVERAAESVLGDEATALRFAQRELEDLSRQLREERERSGEGGPGQPQAGPGGGNEELTSSENPGAARSREAPAPEGKTKDGDAPRLAGGRGETESPEERRDLETNPQGGNSGREPGRAGQSDDPRRTAQSAGGAQGQSADRTGEARTREGAGEPGRRQNGAQESGTAGGSGPARNQDMTRFVESLGQDRRGGEGPLTGERYGEWNERLRTVEDLVEDPATRQRLAVARERAEEMRREFKRHSKEPQWGDVESSVLAPLNAARLFLRQELARREQPDALQPVDRDPVPERYAEGVKKYYEALGQ